MPPTDEITETKRDLHRLFAGSDWFRSRVAFTTNKPFCREASPTSNREKEHSSPPKSWWRDGTLTTVRSTACFWAVDERVGEAVEAWERSSW